MTTTNDKPARKDVEGRIIRVVAFRLGIFPSDIDARTGIGSTISPECRNDILADIESRYDLSIPDADAEKIKTVGQAVDYVMGRM